MHRLRFNVGRQHEVSPGDLVGVIAGVTRIPKELIGAIRLQDRSSFVDVSEEVSGMILKKLNNIKFKGHKLQVSSTESEN
jgi:ATP-dependent RNA helicase DeaD